MSVYVVAHLRDVVMGPEIVEYLQKVDATLASFGGRFVIHGGPIDQFEGTWSGDLVVVEFPDKEHVRSWYNSPAYQAILPLRTNNSKGAVFMIDGVSPDHKATDILS